jgi:hypothetical protein
VRWLIALALASAACTGGDDAFVCHEDSECVLDGTQGVCEPEQACSFPEASCATGRRFGAYSGESSGDCVSPWAIAIGSEFEDREPLLAATGGGFELVATFEQVVVGGQSFDSVGGTDVLTAHVSGDRGRVSNIETFGSEADEAAVAVRSHGADGTVLLGKFEGDFQLGGAALDSTVASPAWFLALRRPDGWVRQIPLSSTDHPSVGVTDVSVDPTGAVWAAGSWNGDILAFGGNQVLSGPDPDRGRPALPSEAFVVAYSPEGIPEVSIDLVEQFAPTGPEGLPFTECSRVAAGVDGLALFCNHALLVESAANPGGLGMAWYAWDLEVRRLVMEDNGTLVIGGTFTTLVPPAGEERVAVGAQDLFVLTASIGRDGLQTQHLVTYGQPGQRVELRDIALRPAGGAVVVGSIAPEAGSKGAALVLDLGADGAVANAETFGGDAGAAATAVAIDREGRAAVAGTFHGTLSVHGRTLAARGQADVFVLRLP